MKKKYSYFSISIILIAFISNIPFLSTYAADCPSLNIQNIVSEVGVQSLVVQELGGSVVQEVNGNVAPASPASTIKLVIADVILNEIKAKRLTLAGQIPVPTNIQAEGEPNASQSITIKAALEGMLKDSSNTNANALVLAAGGAGAGINQKIKQLGYTKTTFNTYLSLPGTTIGANTSTAIEISKAMNEVYSRSGEGYDVAQAALRDAKEKFNHSARVANKIGNNSKVIGNSAVVDVSGKKYIITVYANQDGNDVSNQSFVNQSTQKVVDALANCTNPSSDDDLVTQEEQDNLENSGESGGPIDQTFSDKSNGYQSFTNFPGIGRIGNLCQLSSSLWQIGFVILILSVFGSFIYAGYKYLTSGVNAGKVNEAKELIINALTGLILGSSVFIILNIINPDLLNARCNLPSANIVSSGTDTGAPLSGGNFPPGASVFPVSFAYQGPGRLQSFGSCRDGCSRRHAGVDLTPLPDNQHNNHPFYAFRDGTAFVEGGRCNVLRIIHPDGTKSRYVHNSAILVKTGQKVTAGQIVGKVGSTCTQAVHLHFELYNTAGTPVNPASIILNGSKNPNTSLKLIGSPKSSGGGL